MVSGDRRSFLRQAGAAGLAPLLREYAGGNRGGSEKFVALKLTIVCDLIRGCRSTSQSRKRCDFNLYTESRFIQGSREVEIVWEHTGKQVLASWVLTGNDLKAVNSFEAGRSACSRRRRTNHRRVMDG
jgi:hypothetical protein